MLTAQWLWNFSGYPGAAGVFDDSTLPIATMLVKTHDGLTWQGQYDQHAAEISGLPAVVKAEREIYAPQGIEMIPWGVLHGRRVGQGDLAYREGLLAGQVARLAAGPDDLVVFVADLEPPNHGPYWHGTEQEVHRFMEGYIEEAGPSAELWLAPDARNPWLTQIQFDTWCEYGQVTRVLPQVYYNAFVEPRVADANDARNAIDNAIRTLRENGWTLPTKTIEPILPAPGWATVESVRAAILYAAERGCGGVSFWRRGVVSREGWEMLRDLEDPFAPTVDEGLLRIYALADRTVEEIRAYASSKGVVLP